MIYIPTKKQIVEVLITRLHKSMFEYMVNKLGKINIFIPAWGGALEHSNIKEWFSK